MQIDADFSEIQRLKQSEWVHLIRCKQMCICIDFESFVHDCLLNILKNNFAAGSC